MREPLLLRLLPAACALSLLGCAQQAPPPGGPVDDVPPEVKSTHPAADSLGVAHSLALAPVKLDADVMPDMMTLDASRKRISWYRNASSYSPQPEDAALAYVANTVEPTYT